MPVWKLFRQSEAERLPPPPVFWPVLLIQAQICFVYLGNAMAKGLNPEFISGDVLEGMSENLRSFHLRVDAGWARHPLISMPAWLAALGAVLAEAGIAVVVWVQKPFHRALAWLAVVGFHLLLIEVQTIFMLNLACIWILGVLFLWGAC